MTILALSTSTPRASVALVEDDRVLAAVSYDDPRGHAERLFSLIDEAFAAAGRSRSDIHLVACDIGPGSFTGVRIAVASAKGIAVGLGVPLAGVVSLEAMAAHARATPVPPSPERAPRPSITLVASAIDAKKDELYVAIHDGVTEVLAPSHLPRAEVAARVAELLAGRPYLSIVEAPGLDAGWPEPALALVHPPDASWIGRIAARAASLDVAGRAGQPPLADGAPAQDPAEVVPLYVRAPDAIASISVGPDPFAMLPSR